MTMLYNSCSTVTSSRFPFKRQSLALRALRKRKPQETQALALASMPIMVATASTEHSYWLQWRLRLLREIFTQQSQPVLVL